MLIYVALVDDLGYVWESRGHASVNMIRQKRIAKYLTKRLTSATKGDQEVWNQNMFDN